MTGGRRNGKRGKEWVRHVEKEAEDNERETLRTNNEEGK